MADVWPRPCPLCRSRTCVGGIDGEWCEDARFRALAERQGRAFVALLVSSMVLAFTVGVAATWVVLRA